jgi:hypothetical protein
MERHEAGTARVIPVILRPVHGWQLAVFGKLQALPKDGKPVTAAGHPGEHSEASGPHPFLLFLRRPRASPGRDGSQSLRALRPLQPQARLGELPRPVPCRESRKHRPRHPTL